MPLSFVAHDALVGGIAQAQVMDLRSATSFATSAAAELQQDSATLDLITDGAGIWTLGPVVSICMSCLPNLQNDSWQAH